jgi:hypothetical protein
LVVSRCKAGNSTRKVKASLERVGLFVLFVSPINSV